MAQVVKLLKVFPYADYAVVEWETNGHFKYVACWLMKIVVGDRTKKPLAYEEGLNVKCYWEQGHYFADKDEAMRFALAKERETIEDEIAEREEDLKRLRYLEEQYAEEIIESGETFDTLDDLLSNMPCDNSGYCSGTSCSRYFECQGK